MLGRVIDEIFMDVSRFDFAGAQREGRSNSCGNLCEYGLTRTDKLRGRGCFEEERFCVRCVLSRFISCGGMRSFWEGEGEEFRKKECLIDQLGNNSNILGRS